jgi:hypothetical protein
MKLILWFFAIGAFLLIIFLPVIARIFGDLSDRFFDKK